MLQELFGPLSMRELENDAYVRKTSGYLPEASVAFVDEIFKANSAILNTLLTILNERSFDNGNQRYQIPLKCMVSLPRATMAGTHCSTVCPLGLAVMDITSAIRYMTCLQSLPFLEKWIVHSTRWHPERHCQESSQRKLLISRLAS